MANGRHDIQDNDTRHEKLIYDTKHKRTLRITRLSIECHYAERRNAECRNIFIVKPKVIMLNVVVPANVSFMAGLHYDDYHSRLVLFEAQKTFSLLKNPSRN